MLSSNILHIHQSRASSCHNTPSDHLCIAHPVSILSDRSGRRVNWYLRWLSATVASLRLNTYSTGGVSHSPQLPTLSPLYSNPNQGQKIRFTANLDCFEALLEVMLLRRRLIHRLIPQLFSLNSVCFQRLQKTLHLGLVFGIHGLAFGVRVGREDATVLFLDISHRTLVRRSEMNTRYWSSTLNKWTFFSRASQAVYDTQATQDLRCIHLERGSTF